MRRICGICGDKLIVILVIMNAPKSMSCTVNNERKFGVGILCFAPVDGDPQRGSSREPALNFRSALGAAPCSAAEVLPLKRKKRKAASSQLDSVHLLSVGEVW